MKQTLEQTVQILLEQDQILLLTHRNPDGDTLCSAAALCSALRRAGKKAALYRNVQITEKYSTYVEPYLADSSFEPEYIVSVDIATEGLFPRGFSGAVDLCIDHHPTNSHFAEDEIVCPESSSCGEIILRLIEGMSGVMTKEEADLLYIAVSTDTGCFQYANTNPDTLSAASKLVAAGADNAHLNQIFFRKVSRARIQLEGMIYSSMTFHRNGRIVIAPVTLEMMKKSGATEDDCDDLASLPGRMQGEVVGITIREMEPGRCKISVRTTEEVSAIRICEAFGGGGHQMAAGCSIDAAPERAQQLLLAVVDEVYK